MDKKPGGLGLTVHCCKESYITELLSTGQQGIWYVYSTTIEKIDKMDIKILKSQQNARFPFSII